MSPRRRKNKDDEWMPPRVYRGKSAFEYRSYAGKCFRLCALDAKKSEVWTAYEEAIGKGVVTIADLADKYFNHETYIRLKPSTQADYRGCWDRLKPVFGHVDCRKIRPEHVRKYMDERSSRKRANVERVLLSNIMSHGFERGHCSSNPCRPVKPFKLPGRDRYVTDQEYQAFYDSASKIGQIFMELAYINAARGQDLRKITMSDITADGLMIQQEKTGKKQVKLWNKRLRAVVELAKRVRSKRLEKCEHGSIFLIVTTTGGPYSSEGLKTLWARLKADFLEDTETKIDWTFHDLKAKGISDFEGDKQGFSGHKSRLQMEKYNRSADKTEVIDFKKK